MNVTPAGSPPPIAAPLPARPAAEPSPVPEPAATPVSASRARSLWELLTPEERDFFAQQESLGPLTYRPGAAKPAAPAAPVGRRIDVKG